MWPCCNPREREHWVSFLARVTLAHQADARKVLFPNSPVAFRSPATRASDLTVVPSEPSEMSEEEMLAQAIQASLEEISLVTDYHEISLAYHEINEWQGRSEV